MFELKNTMPVMRSILELRPQSEFTAPLPPIPESEIRQTLEADVVVVGEGLAGLSCALSARQCGLDVLMVTASRGPVGRGGSIFATYSKVMEAKGFPRQDLDRFILQELEARGFQCDQQKFYQMFNRSEEAMNWCVDIVSATGAEPVLEDANPGHPDSPTYQPPCTHTFLPPGGTRAGIGITVCLKAFEEAYLAAGGRVLHQTPVRDLEKTGDRVTGVLARTPEGTYIRIKAAKGVVLATGDFSRNRKMLEVFCPQYAAGFFRNQDAEEDYDTGFAVGGLFKGDGHLMALRAGAAWQRTYPNAVMIQGSRVGSSLPYGSNRSLRLNSRGERFCNEDMNGAYTAITTLREPGGAGFAIWDEAYADNTRHRRHGGKQGDPDMTPEEVRAMWQTDIDRGQVVRADSLEEVCRQLGLPVETAMASIARYNRLARDGYDADFHKDPEYLREIRTGPFYGGRIDARLFFTVLGGPRTNHRMEICDENDEPIPGLYCVGSMVGDFYAGCYSFRLAGENYGAGLTFGYLTGRRLAGLEP